MAIVKKRLYMIDIEEKPLIKTYQYNAFAESIASCHNNYEDWFANNFIQLAFYNNIEQSYKAGDFICGNIFGCHSLLDISMIDKSVFEYNMASCKYEMKKVFEQGYCIYTFVDEFYVFNRRHFQNQHNEHDILLCGCSEDDVIYMGYNSEQQYLRDKMPIEYLFRALKVNNLHCSIIKIDEKKYEFDLNKFIFMLEQYIYSTNSNLYVNEYYDMNKYYAKYYDNLISYSAKYGMDCYENLDKILNLFETRQLEYDIRVLHIISEHKQSLYRKIQYLIDRNYINNCSFLLEEYKKVVMDLNVVEMIGLKFLFIHRCDLISDMRNRLVLLRQKEKSILNNLLNILYEQNK